MFFDKVTLQDLIAPIMGSATPDTPLKSMELSNIRDAPLIFDTKEMLYIQFK